MNKHKWMKYLYKIVNSNYDDDVDSLRELLDKIKDIMYNYMEDKECPFSFEDDKEEELQISNELFYELAYYAHIKDVTVNDLINDIIRKKIEEEKNS
jgi:hypothetical protein